MANLAGGIGIGCESTTYGLIAICPYVLMGILEAMACELPVICSDACHFPEAVTQGGGWECAVSIDSVADALVALMSCSDLELAERGRCARRLAEEGYTWEKLAQDLHHACESSIS